MIRSIKSGSCSMAIKIPSRRKTALGATAIAVNALVIQAQSPAWQQVQNSREYINTVNFRESENFRNSIRLIFTTGIKIEEFFFAADEQYVFVMRMC